MKKALLQISPSGNSVLMLPDDKYFEEKFIILQLECPFVYKNYFNLMKKNIFVLFAFVCHLPAFFAQQQPFCGTTIEDQTALLPRLEANKNAALSVGITERNAVQYVPIHFHLVGDNNSDGKLSINKVLDQLCVLNQQYQNQDIQFYLSPHSTTAYGLFNTTINNNNVFLNQTNATLMTQRRHSRALNVYAVEEPVSGNTQLPGTITQAYYTGNRDWIVMRKSEFSNSLRNGVLAHEIGHFFSLPHTFFGYETNPFNTADAGWPKAPVLSPGGAATERANGTNCTTAGDRICDTPPDFGFTANNCNEYAGGAQDPLGTVVNPSEKNFMGYFNGCNYEFTPQQQNIIRADLNAGNRNYLDNTFNPAATQFTTPATLLTAPASSSTVPFYDQVQLEWNTVSGATHYLLEIDVTPQYASTQLQSYLLTTNSKSITTLQPGRTYYWRVRPFNQYYTCAAARQRSLKTPQTSSAPELHFLQSAVMAPNPVPSGLPAMLTIRSTVPFEAKVDIMDASGRTVQQSGPYAFNSGETTIELSTERIPAGLYFLRMYNAEGSMVKKWAVIK